MIAAPAESALLVDRSFTDTGEEVKVYVAGDRVIALGKKASPSAGTRSARAWASSSAAGRTRASYQRLLAASIEETNGAAEYEDALDRLLSRVPVGWVDVTGFPWTEVDFVEDLRRAESVVLPHVARLDGA